MNDSPLPLWGGGIIAKDRTEVGLIQDGKKT